jgi:hypothetical protein
MDVLHYSMTICRIETPLEIEQPAYSLKQIWGSRLSQNAQKGNVDRYCLIHITRWVESDHLKTTDIWIDLKLLHFARTGEPNRSFGKEEQKIIILFLGTSFTALTFVVTGFCFRTPEAGRVWSITRSTSVAAVLSHGRKRIPPFLLFPYRSSMALLSGRQAV